MDIYQEMIQSVRESRMRMSKECNHDSVRYIAYLKTFNGKYSEQIKSFQKLRESVPLGDPVSSHE